MPASDSLMRYADSLPFHYVLRTLHYLSPRLFAPHFFEK
ncbi:hypothetical protein B4135_3797 [Caldibacillus debilis]|uniref:Uncharacterized protein n=1 Tax=Caldibacillus debilis TaxID=301148 RepID=A0A150LAV5_9BACI|nr:hypothetical protein B4135_3797 [Caldibacillus debilis]